MAQNPCYLAGKMPALREIRHFGLRIVDQITCNHSALLTGWARCPPHKIPTPQDFQVIKADRLIARLIADRFLLASPPSSELELRG
jgi:hypothetical protein